MQSVCKDGMTVKIFGIRMIKNNYRKLRSSKLGYDVYCEQIKNVNRAKGSFPVFQQFNVNH